MTPSERAAIGVTDDQQRVHLLARTATGWDVRYDWPVGEHSHTELLTRLGPLEEPETIEELVSAPYATKLLADLGADVVKIEPLVAGDRARQRGPFPGGTPHPEKSV